MLCLFYFSVHMNKVSKYQYFLNSLKSGYQHWVRLPGILDLLIPVIWLIFRSGDWSPKNSQKYLRDYDVLINSPKEWTKRSQSSDLVGSNNVSCLINRLTDYLSPPLVKIWQVLGVQMHDETHIAAIHSNFWLIDCQCHVWGQIWQNFTRCYEQQWHKPNQSVWHLSYLFEKNIFLVFLHCTNRVGEVCKYIHKYFLWK